MPSPADSADLNGGIQQVIAEIEAKRQPGGRIVFVSGNFNIVHPGHLRLLNFAASCGDLLVVGVYDNRLASALLPQQLRLEGVQSIGVVGYAFLLRVRPEVFIRHLRPDIVVKGKEHEGAVNPEAEAVESYGGTLLFSSGDARFSSLDLLRRELYEVSSSTIVKPQDFPQRHGFSVASLAEIVRAFQGLKVVVVGDLIVDEYISCDALGMYQDDPTLVVSPIRACGGHCRHQLWRRHCRRSCLRLGCVSALFWRPRRG